LTRGKALSTIRFELDPAEAADFVDQLKPALQAIAEQKGYVAGYIGQAIDQPGLLNLVLEFDEIGSYRRAISASPVKYAAHPLLLRALDEPSAFEVLHVNAEGEASDYPSLLG